MATANNSDPHDQRPFIKDLLAEHADEISSVRDAILADEEAKAIYEKGDNATRYDDIWTLRYVLSHRRSIKAAAKAAIKTIKFREEKKVNELGDIRHRLINQGVATDGPTYPFPAFELYDQFSSENAVMVTLPEKDRGIVIYVDVGQVDIPRLAEGMTDQDLLDYILYSNEAIFQIMDGITRRTGRLTKLIKILDVGGLRLKNVSLSYSKRDGKCNKAMEDYYPQLLGTLFIANFPSWLTTLWNVAKPLFPKRAVEKMDFLPPMSKLKESKNRYLLENILHYVSEENLPEKYCGKNKEWPLPCASTLFAPPTSSAFS